ncbi:MAG: S-layer homology domain-containing protein [Bacillota bacterium]
MRKKMFIWLLAALVFLTLPCGLAAAEGPVAEFVDVGSHWAARDIMQCKIFNLMTGYPGKLFMPDRSLSRAEALVVISRSLGWNKQVSGISTAGISFPPDLWEYFRGYVALAANKQLISRNDIPVIEFNKPATRMEIALWLARALELTGKGGDLVFTDLGQVPAEYRDMLAGVVEAGIIKGRPGNLIAPSEPLTRAEMAAILARLIDGGRIIPASGSQVSGKITRIDRAQNTIAVESQSGAGSYGLGGSYLAYRGGRKSDLSSFTTGEEVKLTLDQAGQCVLITSYEKYSAVAAGNRGYVVNRYCDFFTVRLDNGSVEEIGNANVSFFLNGVSTTYGSLKRGSSVELLRSGTAITQVRIMSGALKAFGRVEKVTDRSVTIVDEDGRAALYLIDRRAEVLDINGNDIEIGKIYAGMNVELTLDQDEIVQEIKVAEVSGNKLEGTVKDINTAGVNRIIVSDKIGKSFSYYLAEGVKVRQAGMARQLADVKRGMGVEITLDNEQRVTRIVIINLSAIEGKIADISTSGTDKIVITDNNGQSRTYYILEGVQVRAGSRTINLDDINNGIDVRLTLGDNNWVTGIEIADLSTVSGEVVDIKTSGTKRIVVRNDNGREETYYLKEGLAVREGGNTRPLDNVSKGMLVKLDLGGAGYATGIDIIGSYAAAGKVIDIQSSGTKKITIKDNSSRAKTFYLADGVTVREGCSARYLDDVKKDMDVRIALDQNSRAIRIEITRLTAVEGEVTFIQTIGTEKIEIKKNDGQKWVYYLDNSTVVREGESTGGHGDIVKGMRVRLTLDGRGNVAGIDIIGSHTVKGKVTLMQTSGTEKIGVRGISNQEEIYYLDHGVTVREGGITRKPDYIYEGMFVKLTLDDRGKVTRVDILGSYTIRGEVTFMQTSGTKKIGIRGSNGQERAYNIDDAAVIRKGGFSRNLNDIGTGMDVELMFNSDGQVTYIDIF